MSLQALAQNMAARGRGPDTMLVHMAPSEVKGLQALAMAHGGSLTVNPQTGLPEAGFLSSILPMLAGAFLGPAGAGIFGSALTAGLGVGAATGLATGSLRKGLMAGLGAYGGAGLMSSVMGAGAQGAGAAQAAQAAQPFDYAGIAGTPPIQGIPAAAPVVPDVGFLQPSAGVMPSGAPLGSSGDFGTDLFVGADGYTSAPFQPPVQAAPTPPTTTAMPGEDMSRAFPQPNVSTAMPGEDMSRSFPQQMGKFDQFKAGLSAIGNKPDLLFNKENMKYGLAAAAPLLMAEPKIKKPGSDSKAYRYAYDPGRTDEPLGGPYTGERTYFRPRYTRLAAEGGSMSSEYDYVYDPQTQLYKRKEEITAPSKSGLGALVDAGMGPSSGPDPVPGEPGQFAAMLSLAAGHLGDALMIPVGMVGNAIQGYQSGENVPVSDAVATPVGQMSGDQTVMGYDPGAFGDAPPSATGDPGTGVGGSEGDTTYARGGISHLGDYSDGGRLLRGPGDGVSDDIPATIADKRPARLADGEFVVPARIVSELGNGSTEAGARKLYAMMNRIQKARGKTVGKGKVAVNSRAEKLLPA